MTAVLIVLVIVLALACAALAATQLRARIRRPAPAATDRPRRILFPFMANALSARALDAALRIAIAEDATLVPVFLAHVPLHLPLDTPLPRQCAMGLSLEEAIEQRATRVGVPVDARIERGRNDRHALRRAIEHERYDRIVIAAATRGTPGFDAADAAWLLEYAPGEIVVLRPSSDRLLGPPARLRRARRRVRLSREHETAASR